jgi:hypothetical protein
MHYAIKIIVRISYSILELNKYDLISKIYYTSHSSVLASIMLTGFRQ